MCIYEGLKSIKHCINLKQLQNNKIIEFYSNYVVYNIDLKGPLGCILVVVLSGNE